MDIVSGHLVLVEGLVQSQGWRVSSRKACRGIDVRLKREGDVEKESVKVQVAGPKKGKGECPVDVIAGSITGTPMLQGNGDVEVGRCNSSVLPEKGVGELMKVSF